MFMELIIIKVDLIKINKYIVIIIMIIMIIIIIIIIIIILIIIIIIIIIIILKKTFINESAYHASIFHKALKTHHGLTTITTLFNSNNNMG